MPATISDAYLDLVLVAFLAFAIILASVSIIDAGTKR